MPGAIIQQHSFTSLTPKLHWACTRPSQSQEQAETHVVRPSARVSAAIRLPTALLLPEAHVSLGRMFGLMVQRCSGNRSAGCCHQSQSIQTCPREMSLCPKADSSAPQQINSSAMATGLPQGYHVDTWVWPYRASREKQYGLVMTCPCFSFIAAAAQLLSILCYNCTNT